MDDVYTQIPAVHLCLGVQFFLCFFVRKISSGFIYFVNKIETGNYSMSQRTSSTVILTEAAIMVALAALLSYVKFSGPWVAGGSVSFEMLPLIVFAIRRGLKWGLLAGVVYGFIGFFLNPYFLNPAQLILDYPLPFGLLGLSGLFVIKKEMTKGSRVLLVILATLVAVFARFCSHYLSGIIFYASDAPKGQPVALYSLIYNLGYLLPSFIITLIILILLVIAAPNFIERKVR